MKTNPRRRQTTVWLLLTVFFLAGAIGTADTALAGRRGSDERAVRGDRRHRPAVRNRFHPVRVGRHRYFYRSGHFYRHRPRGYARVRAPVGAIVAYLPPGFRIVLSGGSRYFCFGDVYYRPHPRGYRVVPAPVYIDRTEPADGGVEFDPDISRELPDRDWITVTAEVLNVRSGPGETHPVIGRVRQGRRLEVKGSAPGWSYVRLPHGEHGWVMNRFTTGIAREPRG